MFTRIVVPLEGDSTDRAALNVAADRARQYGCPIHVIGFVDVSHLVRIGCHGPAMDVTACRTTLPDTHAAARDYVTSVANALTARGYQVTYEIRQGLRRFELPAALRAGDLIVATASSNPGPRLGFGESATDPMYAGEGTVVIIIGPQEHPVPHKIAVGRNVDECESFELPERASIPVAAAPTSRR
jgi:hypothetical protein